MSCNKLPPLALFLQHFPPTLLRLLECNLLGHFNQLNCLLTCLFYLQGTKKIVGKDIKVRFTIALVALLTIKFECFVM